MDLRKLPPGIDGKKGQTLLATLKRARSQTMKYLNRTPLIHSAALSERIGAKCHFKLEPFQRTGSFKVRGMMHKLLGLEEEERSKGVVSFSSGNAALGLGYAARHAGVHAKVVMANSSNPAKIKLAQDLGLETVFIEDRSELGPIAEQIARDEGRVLIHPYDDMDLMIGHTSLGLELFDELPNVSTIVTAIGGGSMAGALALTASALFSDVRLVGVEPSTSPQMTRGLKAGKPVPVVGHSVADGLCPLTAGKHCFDLVAPSYKQIVLVSDEEIVSALQSLILDLKVVAEPSGATATAGALSGKIRFEPDETVVVIVSGGNIDGDRLASLLKEPAQPRRRGS